MNTLLWLSHLLYWNMLTLGATVLPVAIRADDEPAGLDLAGIFNNIITAIKPAASAAFVLGLIVAAFGTFLAPLLPEWGQQNKGHIMRGGLAMVLIGIAPALATWLAGIGA
jgi:hypothetical protein